MITKAHVGVLLLLAAGGAAQSPYNRSYVSQGIEDRTAYELGQETQPGQFSLPEGVSLDDGLSEDEAVAVALWNNAQFQTDLQTLGSARADLIEANMLANPVFSLLFPVGPKLFEAKLNIPIDVLWQRPRRIAAAKPAFDDGAAGGNPISTASGCSVRLDARRRPPGCHDADQRHEGW